MHSANDTAGRHARVLVGRAERLVDALEARLDDDGLHSRPRERRERLELELAREEVETKLLKREHCRRAIASADDELRGACSRLSDALSRVRPTVDSTP